MIILRAQIIFTTAAFVFAIAALASTTTTTTTSTTTPTTGAGAGAGGAATTTTTTTTTAAAAAAAAITNLSAYMKPIMDKSLSKSVILLLINNNANQVMLFTRASLISTLHYERGHLIFILIWC